MVYNMEEVIRSGLNQGKEQESKDVEYVCIGQTVMFKPKGV